MIVWVGTSLFGMVLGWVSMYLILHGKPVWREAKVALGVLFGATLQAVFGGVFGIILYGIGLGFGALCYGLTLLFAPLRRAHHL
jgi:hypothetical protein